LVKAPESSGDARWDLDPETDEVELLKQARLGDRRAASVLSERYIRKNAALHRLFRRGVADAAAREDLLHEVYLRLIQSRAEFRGDSALETYIYQVGRRTILERRRSSSTEKRGGKLRFVLAEDARLEDRPAGSSDDPFAEVELGWLLEKLFEKIPEAYREALRLRIVEGESYEDIAGILKTNVNTVSTRIHKGRKLLLELMDKLGVLGRL
jgi:RNA polymerase sigma-70 factor, ECF subfamily